MAKYTSQDLITIVKQKAFIPGTQSTFSDADILNLADSEMRDYILPKIKQTREEFFVTFTDYTVSSGTSSVLVPDRAVGNSFRQIVALDGTIERPLARMEIEDKTHSSSTGLVRGYYLQGNKIHLIGTYSGIMRVYFLTRPGRLVLPSASAKITSITPGATTTVFAAASLPSSWAASETVDMIRATSGFSTLATDISATISGTSITIPNADIPDDFSVGDYISLEDESPIPQVPPEWYSFLAQAVASQILESLGDYEALERSDKKKKEMEENALSLISARVQGTSKKIVSPHNRGYANYWWDS